QRAQPRPARAARAWQRALRTVRPGRGCPRAQSQRCSHALYAPGVRAPVLPLLTAAPGLLARSADGPSVGIHVRPRHGNRDRPHPASPREDRGRSVTPALSRDHLGRGVPVQPMTTFAVVIALGTLAAGLAA